MCWTETVNDVIRTVSKKRGDKYDSTQLSGKSLCGEIICHLCPTSVYWYTHRWLTSYLTPGWDFDFLPNKVDQGDSHYYNHHALIIP